MTLFKSSFPSLDQQACATRMIDAYDEDHICSSCIQPSFFAHECNPNDAKVIAHVQHVRQTIASTPLLKHIEEAHKPHNTSLQASNPVSMNTSFFLQAEGHSADSTGENSPIRQYDSKHDETDSQSDGDSQSLRESYSQSDSHSDDANNSNSDNDHDSSSDNDHESQCNNDNSLYSDDSSIE